MADFGALSKLTKRADAVSESASVLVSRAIRDIRGEISNLSDELNLSGSADARDKAYTMIRNRMNRLGTQLNRLLVAQQQMSAKAAAKSASDMTGVEIKYSAKRAQAIFEMVSPAQGENLAAVFTDKMGANLINSLREATVTALREQAVAGGSMKDTAKAMRDKWFDAVKDGVPKFVDSSGKEWNTQTYFQMNVRTNSMRVYNDCLIDDVARETGSDVMRISTGGDPNCECAAWEGTLVSLTGKTKGLPTYDDAKAGGCFHPNCVHTLEYVDEYADADEIKRAQDHPYQDPGPDGDIWQVQDDRKYEIDQAVKMDEQGMTQEEARVAVDRDNLAASIRAGLIRSDADDLVAKMTDAQVTALCKDGNPPEFQPFKPTKKELADGAVQKWNHGKWGGVVHVDAGASAEDILNVCKIGDGEQNAHGTNAKAPTNAQKAKDDKSTEPKTDATEGQEDTIEAIPAFSTVREASDYAKNEFGTEIVGFDKWNVETVRGIVKAVSDGNKVVGELTQLDGIYTFAAFYKKAIAAYLEKFPTAHRETAAKYLKDHYVTMHNKHGGRAIQRGELDLLPDLCGICLNNDFEKFTPEMLEKSRIRYKRAEGCEGVTGTIAHEIGHMIDAKTDARKDMEIRRIIDRAGRKGIEDGLSKYAADNMNKDFGSSYSEAIADAWCEYKCCPNPRPISVAIGKRIEEIAMEKNVKAETRESERAEAERLKEISSRIFGGRKLGM